MTIRRDLEYLEKQGHIVKIRGGAKSINHLTHYKEDAYQKRADENVETKAIIAKKTFELCNKKEMIKKEAIYFDSGTTVMNVITQLNVQNIFAVTSGLNIALELCRNKCGRVVLLGGNINHDNLATSGTSATEQIEKINIGTAFIAASGFSLNTGFTVGHFYESELKRAVISRAACVILVMDTTKIGNILPYTFAHLDEVDYFITEADLPDDIVAKATESGVVVI